MSKTYYELNFIVWNDISYNRKKLLKFYRRLELCKLLSFIPRYSDEYKILIKIRSQQNQEKIERLYNNEEKAVREAIIENLSRKAATELIIDNRWSKKTYNKISNLPLSDFKIALTRIEELIENAKNVTNQSNKISDDIAGL